MIHPLFLPGYAGARSASMRFTGQASRLVRRVVPRAQSTTNGSAPADSLASLRTVDIDGTTFVAAAQVRASRVVLATVCLPYVCALACDITLFRCRQQII